MVKFQDSANELGQTGTKSWQHVNALYYTCTSVVYAHAAYNVSWC